MKRFFSTGMALLLGISIVGCGSTEMPAAQEGGVQSAEQEEAQPPGSESGDLTPYGKYEDPITVTVSKTLTVNPNFPEGQSSQDNVMLDILREQLGIHVEIAWEAEEEEYGNKLALTVASGELPDVMFIPADSYLVFKQMMDNDMLADLSPAIENCMGEYFKDTFDSYEGRNIPPISDKDGIYAMPSAMLGYEHDQLWLRKDWMEELGLESPKSLEDLKTVLRMFIEKDPGGNGKGNTVGLAVNATKPAKGYKNLFGVEPLLALAGAYPKTWLTGEDGKVYYGSTAPEMKQGLQIVRDMYAEGLIDKSFMTRIGAGETESLISSGKCGAFFGPGNSAFSFAMDGYTNNPNMDWMVLEVPLDADGHFNRLLPPPTGDLIVVSRECEHPEAVFKMINVIMDAIRGINDENYTRLYEGLNQYGAVQAAWNPLSGMNLDYYNAIQYKYENYLKYLETGEIADTMFKEDITHSDDIKGYLDGTGKNPTSFLKYLFMYESPQAMQNKEYVEIEPAYSYETGSSSSLKPTLEKLEDEMYLKIIVGEKSLDAFDEFVEDWYELGGDVLTDEVQEAVDALNL